VDLVETCYAPFIKYRFLPFLHIAAYSSLMFSLNNKYLGIFLSDKENIATEDNEKVFTKKFISFFWWIIYKTLANCLKNN
jgi:hypothetical protein